MDERDQSVQIDSAESGDGASAEPSPAPSRRGALVLGGVGAVGVALLIAAIALWTGDDNGTVDTQSAPASPIAAGESVTTSSATIMSSPVSSATGFQSPPGYPDWQSGTELARVTLSSGEVLRFVETTDGRNLCYVREKRGSVGVSCNGLIPAGQHTQIVQVAPWGGPPDGWHYTIFLPAGLPGEFTLRDDTGATVPFARSSDGRYLVTVQPDLSPSTGAGPPARTFDIVGTDGRRITQGSVSIPPGGAGADPRSGTELLKVTLSSGEPVQIIETPDHQSVCVLARGSFCFSFAGAPESRSAYLIPSRAPGAGSLYYVFLVPNDFPGTFTIRDATGATLPHARSSDGRALFIVDPNATPPQIPPVNTAPQGGSPVRTFDVLGATGQVLVTISTATSPPSGASPAQVALAACMRTHGLDIPELPSGTSTSLAPARVYPPDAAVAAWMACRDPFLAADRTITAPQLAFIDCMARQGRLITLPAGPPADTAAHSEAAGRCN